MDENPGWQPLLDNLTWDRPYGNNILSERTKVLTGKFVGMLIYKVKGFILNQKSNMSGIGLYCKTYKIQFPETTKFMESKLHNNYQ